MMNSDGAITITLSILIIITVGPTASTVSIVVWLVMITKSR